MRDFRAVTRGQNAQPVVLINNPYLISFIKRSNERQCEKPLVTINATERR